jgi:hypothetical protein
MDFPSNKEVKDLFDGMLGREVTISEGTPVTAADSPKPTIATYVDDTGRLSAVVLMEFALTAYCGAALGLVPKGGAEVAIEERQLPESLLDNASEILNVMANTIGSARGEHQKLAETFGPHVPTPPHLAAWAAQAGARVDLRLDVAGYGTGALSIVSTLVG